MQHSLRQVTTLILLSPNLLSAPILTPSQLFLPLLSILATAAALPSLAPRSNPEAIISVYDVPDCIEASGAGGAVSYRLVTLADGVCVDVQPGFLSFESTLPVNCPTGSTPYTAAFPQLECVREMIEKSVAAPCADSFQAGDAVYQELFPQNNHSPTACSNVVTADGTPTVGGQSAR